jgi:hypothetical protein
MQGQEARKVSKRVIAIVAAMSIPLVAVISTQALAYGHGHRGGRDGYLFLLARAAGITHQQIGAAFKGDTNLKTLYGAKKTARENLINCLVSLAPGGNCSSYITAYSGAEQALSQEKFAVWEGLFQKAPNNKQAATVLGELKQLQAQRKSIFSQIFGKTSTGGM